MNKKLLLSVMLLIITTYITNAQSISKQVIGSGGVAISNGTHALNFTIGESIVGLIESDVAIHQGFWAAISEEITLSIENPSVFTEQVSVFPNPASNFIKISYKDKNASDFNTSLYDITGKQIHNIQKNTFNTEANIDISQLSDGMYLLMLTEKESNAKKTFKIIKK